MSEWSVRHHETVKEFTVILNSHMKTAPEAAKNKGLRTWASRIDITHILCNQTMKQNCGAKASLFECFHSEPTPSQSKDNIQPSGILHFPPCNQKKKKKSCLCSNEEPYIKSSFMFGQITQPPVVVVYRGKSSPNGKIILMGQL